MLTFVLFQHTVAIRRPWFGHLGIERHWPSGSTLKFAKNWYREGCLRLRFGLLENPQSVEFPTLASREPYVSYPPGCVLPIWAAAKVIGKEPSTALLMTYNLVNHFLISLLLALTIFFFLVSVGFTRLSAVLFSLVPILVELLMPSPLFYHQNVFFADEAILLPFALLVFLEVVRDGGGTERMKKLVTLVQGVVLFYGILTDYLFVFVVAVLYVKRLFDPRARGTVRGFVRTSLTYWAPVILAGVLFALQIHLLGRFSEILDVFLYRAGWSKPQESGLAFGTPAADFVGRRGRVITGSFFDEFWRNHVANGYGMPAVFLLWASLIALVLFFGYLAFRWWKGKPADAIQTKTLALAALFLVPCFAQVYFLKNHSYCHAFSALKFSLPLATVPYVLIPVFILSFFGVPGRFAGSEASGGAVHRRGEVAVLVAALVVTFAAAVHAAREHPRFARLFSLPETLYDQIGEFIAGNTGYRDVVFSPHFQIPVNPPAQLACAMKRVYWAKSLLEVHQAVAAIQENTNEDFQVNLLWAFELDGSSAAGRPPQVLFDLAQEVRESQPLVLGPPHFPFFARPQWRKLRLYKIDREAFLQKCEDLRRSGG